MNTDNNSRKECVEAFKRHFPFPDNGIAWTAWKMAWDLKSVSSPSPVKEIKSAEEILKDHTTIEDDGSVSTWDYIIISAMEEYKNQFKP